MQDVNYNLMTESVYGNHFLFQGREYDYDTTLYYFRVRWYEPETGRWLSPDPIGISGGLNLYAFCGNDPVNFVDPWGLAHFGTRPLNVRGGRLGYEVISGKIPGLDIFDMEIYHENLFFDDGSNENVGFFKPRKGKNERYYLGPDKSSLDGYDMGPNTYDDDRMRRAFVIVKSRLERDNVEYSLIGAYWLFPIVPGYIPVVILSTNYNCQDFCTELRRTYLRLLITDKLKEIF